MEAWLPASKAEKRARSILSKHASHITIEAFVDDHHGHHDDDHHHTEYPPIEYDTLPSTRHASLLTNLVGRPKYGTIDPTSIMAYIPYILRVDFRRRWIWFSHHASRSILEIKDWTRSIW